MRQFSFFAELKNKSKKQIEKRAIELLKKFDLFDRRNSKVEDLSKGNQQKLQFICTVIHEPDYLVLDEPFSGLDPINTNILKEMILEFKRQGKVIIFSTHLMEFAEKMCDHVVMIDKGKIVLSGSISDIKKRYSHRNISLVYDGDISFLKGDSMIESIEDYGNYTGIKVKEESDVQNVLSALISHKVNVRSFIANDISLHEIFISLVGADSENNEKKEN